MQIISHFIHGQGVTSGTRTLPIFNPALGKTIRTLQIADSTTVAKAIESARSAYSSWSNTTPAQRAKLLFHYKALLEKNKSVLADLITEEHGKTTNEALGSLQRGIDVVEFACGIPQHLKGDYTKDVGTGVDSYALHQPLGVCVGITPFNFPGMIPLWMFPMAIACGNTFVLKPSEKNPSCAMRLVALAKEAGIPDGVINVVHGDRETVEALLVHPDVQAVSFVGSSQVAEQVYKTASSHLKRVQAFGGAKNHCVVMPDAELDVAAKSLVVAAYDCAGERCMAISVVIAVGDALAEALIDKMKPLIARISLCAGTHSDNGMGPLVTQAHWERVSSYIALGQQEGAQLVIDGRTQHRSDGSGGFFMGACLFDQVRPSMRIYREEIFGPVLCIVRVPDFDTALQLVNQHEYGNGTAIFTKQGAVARRFAHQVQAGMVGINLPVPVPVAYHSFGGWKRSIFADTGMYGPEAIRFYTKRKTVTERW